MGGNALKTVKTKRLDKTEYNQVVNEISEILKFQNITFSTIPYIRNKETFGDLDVVIKKEVNIDVYLDMINSVFNPNEIFHNTNTVSFDYKNFQIDFIFAKPEDFLTTIDYLSYNDLGNLVGRFAQSLKLKYGTKGLFYRITDKNYSKDVILSTNTEEIYHFLGLDYDTFKKGFDSIEEMFDFVVNSKYFNPKYFKPDFWDSEDRRRNSKRKNIMLFFEHIKNMPEKLHEFISDNEMKLAIFENFPYSNIYKEIYETQLIAEKKQKIKEKFNGHIIRKKYNISNVKLGNSINNFRKYLGNNFDYFILTNEKNIIYRLFEKINQQILK